MQNFKLGFKCNEGQRTTFCTYNFYGTLTNMFTKFIMTHSCKEEGSTTLHKWQIPYEL